MIVGMGKIGLDDILGVKTGGRGIGVGRSNSTNTAVRKTSGRVSATHTHRKPSPSAELVDASALSQASWHGWRRKGIGGSDVAAIMRVSPWSTLRCL